MLKVPPLEDIVERLKENGQTDEQIQSGIEETKEKFGMFAKTENLLAYLYAQSIGIKIAPIESIAQVTDSRTLTQAEHGDVVTVRGVFLRFDGKVVTLGDEHGIIRCWADEMKNGVSRGDYIEIRNVRVWKSPKKNTYISARHDSEMEVLTGEETKRLEDIVKDGYSNPDDGTLVIATGVVIDAQDIEYRGCPEHLKKVQKSDPYCPTCGAQGVPLTIKIFTVSNGDESVLCRIPPKPSAESESYYGKGISVLGVWDKRNQQIRVMDTSISQPLLETGFDETKTEREDTEKHTSNLEKLKDEAIQLVNLYEEVPEESVVKYLISKHNISEAEAKKVIGIISLAGFVERGRGKLKAKPPKETESEETKSEGTETPPKPPKKPQKRASAQKKGKDGGKPAPKRKGTKAKKKRLSRFEESE